MPQKRTYILFILSVIIALLSIAGFYFVFNTIKNKNLHASALSQTIQSKLIANQNISNLKKVIESTKGQKEVLQSYIVNQNKVDEFVSFIENLGELENVPIVTNLVDISDTKPNIISIGFRGNGSFQNIMRLLYRIENAPYQIHFTQVNFSSTLVSDNNSDSKIQSNIKYLVWGVDVKFNVTSSPF